MEKILKIEEGFFKLNEADYDWQAFEGFVITTSLQIIKIGIESGQSCCETFGHLTMNDEISDFINQELLSISVVDTALNTKVIDAVFDLEEGDAMFVNLETSNGLLQFAVYNAHNGYYGHKAVIISKQLNISKVI
jgi:hypothetical protein